MHEPLRGLRVLDLSRVLSGPFCTMVLADLGADVVKVERPDGGDDTRAWGPPFAAGESAYYLSINRNKRSIAVDLKHPEGRAVVERLAEACDVVVENFRPGVADALGLGYGRLSARNPRLIYCSISGFGQDGPYRDRPGYDLVAQAMSGLMDVTGYPGSPPVRVGVAIADLAAGLWAALAILAALHRRERTGRGEYLDVALLDGMVALMTYALTQYLVCGQEPGRWGSAHPNIVPYQAFEAADGWLLVCVGNQGQWRRLCQALDLPHLADDPRFATNEARVRHRDALIPLLAERLRAEPRDAWLERLHRAGVPAAPVYRIPEVAADPHLQQRGAFVEVDHPEAGPLRLPGLPVRLGGRRPPARRPPPRLGEHTDEILTELGYPREAIARLRAAGAVR